MIDDLNITQLVATNIKLSQTLYTEKDKSTPCVNYIYLLQGVHILNWGQKFFSRQHWCETQQPLLAN